MKNVYKITDNNLDTFYFRRQDYYSDTVSEFRAYDNYLKIFRILDGEAIWKIEKNNYHVKKDDLLILNSNERRQIILEPGQAKFSVEYVQFLPIMMYPHQQCIMCFFYRNPGFTNLISRDNPCYSELYKAFDEMALECEMDNKFKNEYIYSLLLKMIATVARVYDSTFSGDIDQYSTIKNYEMISAAVQYISQYPYEDLSEDILAKKFYISKYYFSRLFKLYNGISLLTYIRNCRVNYALNLIRNEHMDIADAAFSSGFGSISGFYKSVKDVTGSAPGKLAKKEHWNFLPKE